MKNRFIIIFIFFVSLFHGCREKYEMKYESPQTSYLVVEGIINTQGSTKVNLSRTTLLSEKGTFYENGAALEMEGEDNSVYPLLFEDSGRYVSANLMLNEDVRYRLRIKTKDDREYISSFVQPVKTPEIDSITWIRSHGGIEIFASSNDATNNTRYYKFDYEETWEFKSPLKSNLVKVFKRTPPGQSDVTYGFYDSITYKTNDSIYTCWQSRTSTGIFLASTVRFGENKLYASILRYPEGAWEFSYLYSMNFNQMGLSEEGYLFFQKMKRNTESLGSIFDAQPSEIIGNVRCVSDTTEKVVGFVDATRIKSKRIFINRSELSGWPYSDDCIPSKVPLSPKAMYDSLYVENLYPTAEWRSDMDNILFGIYAASPFCVDCTLRGTNARPSFWPN